MLTENAAMLIKAITMKAMIGSICALWSLKNRTIREPLLSFIGQPPSWMR